MWLRRMAVTAMALSAVLFAATAAAKLTTPPAITGQGSAVIKFNGTLLNIQGNHVEAEFHFTGTNYNGATIYGDGYMRFPAELSESGEVVLDWSVAGEAYAIFTGTLDLAPSTQLVEGRGRVLFTGEITKILDMATGAVHYQVAGQGDMRWNGDLW